MFVRRNIKDSLFDGEIFDSFKLLLSKAKKSAKGGAAAGGAASGDVKSAIDELDQLMDAIVNSDGVEGLEGAEGVAAGGEGESGGDAVKDEPVEATRSTRGAKKPATKKGGAKSAAASKTSTRKKSTRKVVDSSEDEMDFSAEEEEVQEEVENVKPKAGKASAGRRGVKQ